MELGNTLRAAHPALSLRAPPPLPVALEQFRSGKLVGKQETNPAFLSISSRNVVTRLSRFKVRPVARTTPPH